MNLFYYTEIKESSSEAFETKTETVTGYSFNIEDVILTYPNGDALNVVLSMGADKMNPVEYQYKKDASTGQRVPVKVSKYEITNEPIVIELKVKEEINRFFSLTGGPQWEE